MEHRLKQKDKNNGVRQLSTAKNAAKPFFAPTFIQPKLTVNAPNDIYEKEADAVADKVMRMPDSASPVQRKCKHCEEEEASLPIGTEKLQRKPLADHISQFVQRKGVGVGADVSPQTASSLQSSKGSGRSLPETTRNFMESRFGTDFGHVNIHTDSNAVRLSRDLNAQAFTHGSNIYFNEGEFAPETANGKRLLAHELTHVVQQGNLAKQHLQRSPDVGSVRSCSDFNYAFTGYINNPNGEVPYQMGGIPKEGDPGKPLKLNGKTVVLKHNRQLDFGQIGYKYWRAVCLNVPGRKDPEIFWVRNSYISNNSAPTQKTTQPSEFIEVDTQAGFETGTGGEAIKHIGKLGRIGATDENYNDIVSTGKKIYSKAIHTSAVKFKLKYNEIVELVGLTKSGWAFISSPLGQGWVQAQYVHYPLPDFKTELHFVQKDEMLKDVMASYYSSKGVDVGKWGADVRLYVHATALLNKNRIGIGYYEEKKGNVAWYERVLLDETGEETQEIWNSIFLKSGHNIWLPSVDLIKSMKAQGVISGGSISHSVFTAVLEGFLFNIGLSIGVLEGLWTALVDTLTGIVDLVTLIGDLIKKLINGELIDYLKELYQGMKDAILGLPDTLKKMWDEFMAMSPFDKGRAVGKVIGMILFEILIAFFSGGTVTAVKWAGKGGKLAKAFGKIAKLKKKAGKITKHVDAPDPKLKSKIDDGLKKKVRTLTPDQQKQGDIIGDVESGRTKIENYGEKKGNYKRKGNYGEMKMDAHMEHNRALRDKGYDLERISSGRVTDINQKIARGIDGVYENAKPPPKYIIAESKFGSSQLSPSTKDGPQMSDTWITGSQRLENAVGRAKAREILKEGYERVLIKVDANGNVITKKIDSGGKVTTDWP